MGERFAREEGAAGAGAGVGLAVEDGAATCFFCEGRTASAACESCGRFLCERCQVDWAGHVTCLTCVHANRELRDNDLFKSRRVLYDNLALLVLLAPLAVPVYGVFFSVVLSPVALYLALRHWGASRGIVPRGRARLIAVVVIAGLMLVGGVIGVGALFHL